MASVFSPRLPKEVWRNIFEDATHVPGELNTVYDRLAEYSMWGMFYYSRRDIEASYKLRRTIVLVCKLWNEVGTPILYRSIVIRKLERTMPSLYAALKPITRRNPIKFASASFIRRIDVDIYSEYSEKSIRQQKNGFKDLDFLLSLLKRSPMLRIFSISMFPYPIATSTHLDRFFKKLYDCLPLSLKSLSIKLHEKPKLIDGSWALPINLPHHSLDTITLSTSLPIAVFKVGNVRSLEMSPSFQIQRPSRINFPSALTTLRMSRFLILDSLKELGKQLKCLEIWEPWIQDDDDLHARLETVAKCCTRLDTLLIYKWADTFEDLCAPAFPPLGIRRLGLKLLWSPLNVEKMFDRMINVLKDICRSSPGLREIFLIMPHKFMTQKVHMLLLEPLQSCARSFYEVTGVEISLQMTRDR